MFRLEKPDDGSYVGDDIKSGSVRLRGKPEPFSSQRKLSPEEIKGLEDSKAYNLIELKRLEGALKETGYTAGQVLEYPNLKTKIEPKLPPGFRYRNLDQHLKTLDAQGK